MASEDDALAPLCALAFGCIVFIIFTLGGKVMDWYTGYRPIHTIKLPVRKTHPAAV